MEYNLPSQYFERRVSVALVGCGGTGSQILPRLVQLHRSMLALGHPAGLSVTVFDDDIVAPHNCVRQNFVECDVGRRKSEVSIYRINVAHGLDWVARRDRFEASESGRFDIVIGAVDTKASRRSIRDYLKRVEYSIWLDMGNEATTGQMVAGVGGRRADKEHLPLVTDLFPEIVEGEDDNTPSCSAVASLVRQGLATNLMAATLGFSWLAEVFRHGKVGWCGAFFSLDQGRVSPIPVDTKVWASMGYAGAVKKARKPRTKKAAVPNELRMAA